MIKNERRYRITKGWIQKFTRTLARLEADNGSNTPLSVLERKVREYEASRAR